MIELEILNKLYLELSQIVTAKTSQELALEDRLAKSKVRVREDKISAREGIAPSSVKEFTYVSKQATNCAVCGERKHTPIRNDVMGGYVCLTCIDRELVKAHAEIATHSYSGQKCPFCGFNHFSLDEAEECIECPACGARGPTDWKRFGDTELIPLEMWERRKTKED